jgi:hypothetical protein
MVLFLWWAAFLPFQCFSSELLLALFSFSKYVVRVALLFGLLAPHLAALAVVHLSGSWTVPWPLVLMLLASAELCSTGPASPA